MGFFDKLIETIEINGVKYGHFLHSKKFIEYNKSIGKEVQEDYWEQLEVL